MKPYFSRVAVIVCLILSGCSNSSKIAEAPKITEAAPWDEMERILARIKPPKFAPLNFPITQYGAVAGIEHDSSDAITKAIDACNRAGGGHVIVPAGEFLTGPITLKSNVDLHLEEGATLKWKTDPAAYPAVFSRFESSELYNFSPFIYALDQQNIAVTGTGTLDGQANNTNWWGLGRGGRGAARGTAAGVAPTTQRGGRGGGGGRQKIMAMNDNNTPVEQRRFTVEDGLRPNFFQPVRCKNVMIEGVHFRNSPMWEVNPTLCTNVIVRNLDIVSHGPNNDGCDPDSCKDVLIEGCLFDTGDDCIAIKSGRNNDGRRINVASENLVVRNCIMKDGHGGVSIGSEISGNCRNVFVENCKMDSPNLNVVLRIKSNSARGGIIENVYMRNCTVGQVSQQVLQIDYRYMNETGAFFPIARNIMMDNVTVNLTPQIARVTGVDGVEIKNIRIKNSTFHQVGRDDQIDHSDDVKLENCVVEKKAAT